MKLSKVHIYVLILIIVAEITYARSIIRPRPDPWFTKEVSIDPSTIPAEIIFNPESQTIINNTDVPLYVVRVIKLPLEWIGILPDNVFPRYKVVSNTSYQFIYENDGWVERGRRIIAQKPTGSIDVFNALISHDRNSIAETYGPGRPPDAKPPEPKKLIFAGFYGSQKIVFEGILSYKINENYIEDRWFNFDKLEINEEQLPPGIEINPIPKRFTTQRFLYEIFNSSDTPFYIVKEFDSPIDWLKKLPKNVLPDYKLVSGNSYISKNIQHPTLTNAWQLNQNRPMLQITPLLVSQLLKIDFRLLDKKEDCRPEKVDIPEPQPFEIAMFYGETKHLIRGDIIFKLNEDYEPLAGSPDINNCDEDKQKIEVKNKWKPTSSYRECHKGLAGYGKRAKAICYDFVNTGRRGPLMVVIPSGGEFNNNFAISKYEISVEDYSKYCAITKTCTTEKNKEKLNDPITEITLEQAKVYAAWVSERTGKTYRLPTTSEWAYAAAANGEQPKKDFNCRVTLEDKIIKGTGTVNINSGDSNGWGLKNYVGNVQEWVIEDSGKVMVAGGYFGTDKADCNLDYINSHDGNADNHTGFRVLMEMK